MGNRKINSAIYNPNSALNYYPSKFKKTCSIADVSKYNKDHELFLCGRLLELNDLEKRGILSDESGEIDLQFKENQTNIGEGDIVQASGYLDSKNIFLVGSFTKLVPGQVSKVNKEERSHSRWRELLNNRHQQEILRFRSAFLHTSRDFFLQQGLESQRDSNPWSMSHFWRSAAREGYPQKIFPGQKRAPKAPA